MMQRYLRPAGRGSSMDEATLKREDAGVSDFGGNEERVKKHGFIAQNHSMQLDLIVLNPFSSS